MKIIIKQSLKVSKRTAFNSAVTFFWKSLSLLIFEGFSEVVDKLCRHENKVNKMGGWLMCHITSRSGALLWQIGQQHVCANRTKRLCLEITA